MVILTLVYVFLPLWSWLANVVRRSGLLARLLVLFMISLLVAS